MNIQFMTDENAITVKDEWTGEDKQLYIPNFDELAKNASCEEEVQAIREIEARFAEHPTRYAFVFRIVFMAYTDALVTNKETKKQEWVKKWQIMQHPWYKTWDNKYHTKAQMREEIESYYK